VTNLIVTFKILVWKYFMCIGQDIISKLYCSLILDTKRDLKSNLWKIEGSREMLYQLYLE